MKKILVATDKFKGSLSAEEACLAIISGLLKTAPTLDITPLPLADGGEGSLLTIGQPLGLEMKTVEVQDALFRNIKAAYGWKEGVAFIEMAEASGLQHLRPDEQNPMLTSSVGTGQLIMKAIDQGGKNIYLFIGGSATNDGGIGMAYALGFRFFDSDGHELPPIGQSLLQLASIEGKLADQAKDVKFTVVTDVDNVLYGNHGAAKVYAQQKGASADEIEILDQGLKNYANVVRRHFQIDISTIPGAGAAGGLGAGAITFLGAQIKKGTDTIFDVIQFGKKLNNVDLVITGEGKFDQQSLRGKVVKGVIDRCKDRQIPVVVFCGTCELDDETLDELPVKAIKSIVSQADSMDDAIGFAAKYLIQMASDLINELK